MRKFFYNTSKNNLQRVLRVCAFSFSIFANSLNENLDLFAGYKVSQPICQNTVVEDVVDQQLCDISQMPQVKLLECNPEPCPPK